MDRIAPTRRPEGSNAGTQRWTDLLFVHYEVDPEELRKVVPRGVELDLWEGRAYVGLVPFKMERIAPPFFPGALGLNFLETNLRTYVHREGRDPGVYFFSLEADNRLAVAVAKKFWGLPYHDARMRCDVKAGVRDYRSVRASNGVFLNARWRTGATGRSARVGTVDHFLLERYLLYVEREGGWHVGQVHHTPYPTSEVELLSFDESLVRAAGVTRLTSASEPAFVHASPGVDVEVFATKALGSARR